MKLHLFVVTVMKPMKGQWRVTVEAVRVTTNKQPYALVITGTFIFGTRFGYREGTSFRSDYYPYYDNITSIADLQGIVQWKYNCCFCILSGTLCLIIIIFPLLKN